MKKQLYLMLVILLAFFSTQCRFEEKNHIQVPLEQVQNLYAQIDLPSGFQEIDSHSNAKRESTITSHFYKSSLPYSEVISFFNDSLTRKNWIYNQEEIFEKISADDNRKRFGYKKEGCELWIEYNGLSRENTIINNFNYVLSLVC